MKIEGRHEVCGLKGDPSLVVTEGLWGPCYRLGKNWTTTVTGGVSEELRPRVLRRNS